MSESQPEAEKTDRADWRNSGLILPRPDRWAAARRRNRARRTARKAEAKRSRRASGRLARVMRQGISLNGRQARM